MHGGKNYSLLLRKSRKVKPKEYPAFEIIWKRIYDEYLAEFGLSESMKLIIEKQEFIRQSQLEQIINDSWDKQTFIEIAEAEIKDILDRPSASSLDEICIQIERRMHTQIDIEKCSVKKFYTYISIIDKENKNG